MIEITYTENQIRESLKHEYKELLSINIKYPEFSGVNDFINNFYKSLAEKLHDYAKTKYFDDVVHRYEISEDPRKRFKYKPESFCVNFKVTLLTDRFISLYTDYLFYSNNKLLKKERHSQTWSGNVLFSLNALFHRDKRFRKYGKSDFFLTDNCLVLYNLSNEDTRIPLTDLKSKLDIFAAI